MTIFVRVAGILAILLGLVLAGGILHIVIMVPTAQWPTKDPNDPTLLFGFGLGLIVLGYKCVRVGSEESSKAREVTPDLPEPTPFEKGLSGVSRSRFYGISCLILGFGILIPIAGSYLKSNSRDDVAGSLVCAGIGPLPLITLGIYLLWRPFKPTRGNSPEAPGHSPLPTVRL